MTDRKDVDAQDNTLLTTHAAAHRLGLAPGTLCNWRSRGRGPAYLRLQGKGSKGGGAIRYTAEDLARYIAQCKTPSNP
jgi:hypothetical protein